MPTVSQTDDQFDVDHALAVALDAVTEARGRFLASSTPDRTASRKADGSPVTATDVAIEELLKQKLSAAFPDHGFTGEETGAVSAEDTPYRWVIDPIDGTVGFSHGAPTAAILVALQFMQETVLSVVDVPVLDWCFTATRGGGAFENGQRIFAKQSFDPEVDIVCHGDRYTFDLVGLGDCFDRLQAGAKFYRSYTDAFGHCLVARGTAALVVDAAREDWDYAAVELLVREAGGTKTLVKSRNGSALRTMISGAANGVDWAVAQLEPLLGAGES